MRRKVAHAPLGALSGGVLVLAVCLWSLLALAAPGPNGPEGGSGYRWDVLVLLAAGFLLTEAVQLHVEVRRQALSLSLSEIPLVVGLFLVPASGVLACRLVGGLLVAVWRRTTPSKTVFNAITATAEVAAVFLVFETLQGHRSDLLAGPAAWSAAYAALLVGTLLSGVLVILAIRRLQGGLARADLTLMAAPALVSSLLNTTIALVVLIVLQADRRAGLLLVVLLGASVVAYRAYGELFRRHGSLTQLQDLSAAWADAESVRDVSRELLLYGAALLRAGHMELHLRDGDVDFHATLREHDGQPAEVASVNGAALLAHVAGAGTTVLLPRGRRDRPRPDTAGSDLRDAIGVPLRHGGETFGALLVANRLGETSTFDALDLEMVELIAAQASVALHNGRLIDRLRHEATHDRLTGLPNRAALQDGMAARLAADRSFSVLLMDLDGFKEVNDTLGHHHGDELLRAVAGRLRSSLPACILVARLGGDEFAVLAPLEPDELDGPATARLLHQALSSPFLIDGVPLDVRASVGVSVSPDDGLDGMTLLRRADIAMYEAKSAGVPVQAYDAAADRSSHRRLALVAELRGAIDRDELVCYYQPKVDLRTGEVRGAEALVRWLHPELGLVLPDDFVPISEQTGLIVPLTTQVLGRALRDCTTWQAWGLPMGVAVNVSPRGLLAAGFSEGVARVLAETSTPPELLTLEITESSVMADPGRAVRVLNDLHALGVRLSVDDFGTGYSSLAYLQRLPVHEVKIDKSFVGELRYDGNRTAIVRAIVDLGHNLGLQVVAEGVEAKPVARLLLDIGCDLAQGYLYSRPLPAAAYRAWCAAPSTLSSPRPEQGPTSLRTR